MDIQTIFYALLGILSVIMTIVVMPYIKEKYKGEEINRVYNVVSIAVGAAEQILKENDPTGEKRKEYVKKLLMKYNLSIDSELLNDMIEKAVLEVNKWKNELVGDTINNINVNTEELKKPLE